MPKQACVKFGGFLFQQKQNAGGYFSYLGQKTRDIVLLWVSIRIPEFECTYVLSYYQLIEKLPLSEQPVWRYKKVTTGKF